MKQLLLLLVFLQIGWTQASLSDITRGYRDRFPKYFPHNDSNVDCSDGNCTCSEDYSTLIFDNSSSQWRCVQNLDSISSLRDGYSAHEPIHLVNESICQDKNQSCHLQLETISKYFVPFTCKVEKNKSLYSLDGATWKSFGHFAEFGLKILPGPNRTHLEVEKEWFFTNFSGYLMMLVLTQCQPIRGSNAGNSSSVILKISGSVYVNLTRRHRASTTIFKDLTVTRPATTSTGYLPSNKATTTQHPTANRDGTTQHHTTSNGRTTYHPSMSTQPTHGGKATPVSPGNHDVPVKATVIVVSAVVFLLILTLIAIILLKRRRQRSLSVQEIGQSQKEGGSPTKGSDQHMYTTPPQNGYQEDEITEPPRAQSDRAIASRGDFEQPGEGPIYHTLEESGKTGDGNDRATNETENHPIYYVLETR